LVLIKPLLYVSHTLQYGDPIRCLCSDIRPTRQFHG